MIFFGTGRFHQQRARTVFRRALCAGQSATATADDDQIVVHVMGSHLVPPLAVYRYANQ
jgi:glucan phosphoethanolaminetransferase (alkaline phosphatase superfamily)